MSTVPLRVIDAVGTPRELPQAVAAEAPALASVPAMDARARAAAPSPPRVEAQGAAWRFMQAMRAQATALMLGALSLGGLVLFWHLATT